MDGDTTTVTSADPGPVLDLPRRSLDLARHVAVMGIVNRTPDSFYDGGETFDFDVALDRALGLEAAGAEIIDIGGVKGGPGDAVSVEEERDRVVPLVKALRERSDVLVSVDTFRAPVADAALAAGADIINDVTGGYDADIFEVVAARGGGYVAMHHGGEPRTRPFRHGYWPDVTTAVVRHLRDLVARAVDSGVGPRRVIIDPGHDFQKTTYHSLELTRRLDELAVLGHPVLVALSNKDFIGETIGAPIDERVDASIAAAVFAVLHGARIVRVHEVSRTVAAMRMTEALLGWRGPAIAVRGLE